MERLLTLNEAAEMLRRSPNQLRWMRHNRKGPPSANIGGRIMYRQAELERWVDEQFTNDALGRTGTG